MALGSTQPVTEMSIKNLPGSRAAGAFCNSIVWKMWEPRVSKPYGPPRPVTEIALPILPFRQNFTFYLLLYIGPHSPSSNIVLFGDSVPLPESNRYGVTFVHVKRLITHSSERSYSGNKGLCRLCICVRDKR
jgi:hypothetical protein